MIQTLFGSLNQPEEKKTSLFERMKQAVTRTRANLTERIEEAVSFRREIDPRTLDDLVSILTSAALGSAAPNEVLTAMREKVDRKQIGDTPELKRVLKDELLASVHRA